MDAKTVSAWGSIIVSVVALGTFTGALVVSFFFKDSATPLCSASRSVTAIANATTAVGFWLGGSSGSQKKDDVIGAALGTGGGGGGTGGAGGGATGAGGATGTGGATGAGNGATGAGGG